jgi:hypothetical protein
MGDESLVTITTRDPAVTTGLVITPGSGPNFFVQFLSTTWVIFIRALRTFLQTMTSGSLIAALGTNLLPGDIFDRLKVAAVLALGAVIASVLQNLLEVATELNKKYPSLMG